MQPAYDKMKTNTPSNTIKYYLSIIVELIRKE